MKKFKRRAVFFACILMLVSISVLLGCTAPASQQPDPGLQGNTVWYGPIGYGPVDGAAFLTDDVYFFVDKNTSLLSCSDINTGVTVPLCNKVMCEHEDESCEAYLVGSYYNNMIFFWNDGLYYTEKDFYGVHLCRRNPDGTGLSKVATLCYEEQEKADVEIAITSMILTDGKIYFLADITTVVREEDVLISKMLKIQICCLDLISGKQTVVAEHLGDNNDVALLAAGGGSVVYSWAEMPSASNADPGYLEALTAGAAKLIRVDEDTKEQTVLFEKTRADFNNPKFFGSSIFYYPYEYDEDTRRTAFDLNTGEETSYTFMGTSMINAEYGIKKFWEAGEGSTICVVENKTETCLPLELPGDSCYLKSVSDQGLVLELTQRYLYEESPRHKTTLYYIPISALPDGIQAADAVKLYEYRHD